MVGISDNVVSDLMCSDLWSNNVFVEFAADTCEENGPSVGSLALVTFLECWLCDSMLQDFWNFACQKWSLKQSCD